MSRLVVVSNRVAPPTRSKSGAEGGLAVAVLAALRDRGGVWFGWSGEQVDHEPKAPAIFTVGNLTYATIDLSQDDYQDYYYGFANRTLWPLFHYRLDLAEFSRRTAAGYYRVNRIFATHLQPLLEPDDMIWVHDYHLIPMAERLRSAGCRQRMGFFLHIPWPATQILVALPNHEEIVRALCYFDLVGFQSRSDLQAFCDYIVTEAGGSCGKATADGQLIALKVFGRQLAAGAFPIGIDADTVTESAEKAVDSRQTRRLKQSLGGSDLIIGVDRLDYSKGLVKRMESFECLLRMHPERRGRCVLMQVAPASRSDVPEYIEIKQELEGIAGRVNGTYAEFDWQPIRYLNKGYNRRTLTGFFRIARVGLVTPLRDGMNLVAKEYVAAQSPKDPGVLVLSRFAGAAPELGDGALIVNPYDEEGVGEALQRALSMPLAERQERWKTMYDRVRRNDVTAWRADYLKALAGIRKSENLGKVALAD